MLALIVNGGHLAGSAIGFALIIWLAGQERFRPVFWPLVAAGSAVMAIALFLVTDPYFPFEDFRRAYWEGGVAALGGPGAFGVLYDRGTDGFVNIPIVAYLFAPFGLMSENVAAYVFTALGVASAVVAWRMTTLLLDMNRRDSALLLFAFACFGPMLYSIREGNLSHVLLVPLIGGLLAYRIKRNVLAGVLFGLFALIKPAFVLIGVYFLLRQQWRVVLGGAAVLVGSALASLAIFGWDMHVHWYEKTIVPVAGGPLPAFNAQSVASFIARFETGVGGFKDWDPHVLSSAGALAVGILSAAIVAVCGFAFMAGRRWVPDRPTIELEALMIVTLLTLVSSLSWSHYFVWLLPAYALALLRLQGAWRYVAIAALVLSLPPEFISATMTNGVYGPASNTLTSHLMIGGLLVFACLFHIRRNGLGVKAA